MASAQNNVSSRSTKCDKIILEAFLNFLDPQHHPFPTTAFISMHQQQDAELQAARQHHPQRFQISLRDCAQVIEYQATLLDNRRISIPDALLDHIIVWFHHTMRIQGKEIMFNALTCIDPVTNLTEITRIVNKTSNHVAQTFANMWLACYPRPLQCIHDNGGEFIGAAFQRLLFNNNIKAVPTTVKKQSNVVCEQMHKIVGNILRTMLQHIPLHNVQHSQEALIDHVLPKAMHSS